MTIYYNYTVPLQHISMKYVMQIIQASDICE